MTPENKKKQAQCLLFMAPKQLIATVAARMVAPTPPRTARPKSRATVLLNMTVVCDNTSEEIQSIENDPTHLV